MTTDRKKVVFALDICIVAFVGFIIIFLCLNNKLGAYLEPAESLALSLGLIAITESIIAVFISALLSRINYLDQEDSKQEDIKQQKEFKEIEDSLDKFCIPLQNLLTGCYDNNGDKQRIVNEINTHKHLGERLTTQQLFEKYLQNTDTNTETSKILLIHVENDIGILQNRFKRLKEHEL
jgi:hypothetical protein